MLPVWLVKPRREHSSLFWSALIMLSCIVGVVIGLVLREALG